MIQTVLGFLGDYWISLAVGMGIGGFVVAVHWFASGRKTASFRAPSPATPSLVVSSSENRQTQRRDGNPLEVLLALPDEKDHPVHAFLLNRSQGGVCLSLSEEATPGTVLSLRPVKAPEMMPWIDIEVRSCKPATIGWEIGCRFVKTPPFAVYLLLN